jgi:hypothetical protein
MGLSTISGEIQAQPLNDNFSYLGNKIEKLYIYNVLDYGAVGDGVIDDTAAIQAAHDAILSSTSGKGVLFFPTNIYRTTSTIDIDVNCVIVDGNGATILSDGGAVCLNLVNSFVPNNSDTIPNQYAGIWGQSCNEIRNLKLNWKSGANAIAIKLLGFDLNPSGVMDNRASVSMVQMSHVYITGFTYGLYLGAFTFNSIFIGGAIGCQYDVYVPTGVVQGFERHSFFGTTLGGGIDGATNLAVYNAVAEGLMTFDSCSFDYSDTIFDLLNGAKISCNGCHFESLTYADYWFKLQGDGAMLNISNSEIMCQGDVTHALFYVNPDVAEGGLALHNVLLSPPMVSITSYANTYHDFCLVEGGGNVVAENIPTYSQAAPLNISQTVNLLPSYGFEAAPYGLTLSGGAAISSAKAKDGTYSLLIPVGATADTTFIGQWSGKRLTLSCWGYAEAGESGYVGVVAQDNNGTQIGYAFSITVNQIGWNFYCLNNIISMPAGTTKLYLVFTGGVGNIYFDDVVMNVF